MNKTFRFKTLILVAMIQVFLITIVKLKGYSPLGDQTTCGTYSSCIGYVYINFNLINDVG